MTNLQATKLEERINKLAAGFAGQILLPGNDAYESARRIWNAMIDRRPALIARCATASDVARAVVFARETGLPLAVRGGGHNIAGSAICEGGIVIDLSGMKAAASTPARAGSPSRRARCCPTSTPRPRRTGWRRRSASTRRPGSPGSRWAAASAGSAGSTA